MLVNRAGLVFAGQRADGGDQWQMPQGGIDEGETPLAAARRELEEETGVAPALAELVAEAPEWLCYDFPPGMGRGRHRGQRQRWFLFRFVGSDADVNIDTAHPEFRAWRWADAESLPELVIPFKREVYGRVVAAFRPLLVPA